MKPFDLFVVELEKTTNDTITTDSGIELFIDTKFNEFEHRVTEGPVVSAVANHNTGVNPGDTLYFHHLVVMNEGQTLTGYENHYLVRYNPEHAVNNQAIAYKNSKGEINLLGSWTLLTPIEESEDVAEAIIEIITTEESDKLKGRLAFESSYTKELGISAGDVVGFKKNMDYRITIDGQEYYRVRSEDLLYVEI
jgi:co-chaperonin GroES (HSP10)